MVQASYTFKDVVSGDTQDEVSFEMKINTVALDLTDFVIRMNLLKSNGEIAQAFTTENGTILITDAVNGLFKIPAWICACSPNTYESDIEFTFPNGEKKSYIRVTQKVLRGYT